MSREHMRGSQRVSMRAHTCLVQKACAGQGAQAHAIAHACVYIHVCVRALSIQVCARACWHAGNPSCAPLQHSHIVNSDYQSLFSSKKKARPDSLRLLMLMASPANTIKPRQETHEPGVKAGSPAVVMNFGLVALQSDDARLVP